MKYVAFIRGVGPENPNMHGAKLKWFFEELGFKNVQTVIASGNVIFESDSRNKKSLEDLIEKKLPKLLGFNKATIVRSHEELKKIFISDPFNGTEDTPNSRLNVTFLKNGKEIFSIIDPESTKTPEIMRRLEKENGKDITMRTWKTIGRILKRME